MNSLHEDPPPPSVPEWLLTYGDLMSLLLTFFVMLVSMSELQERRPRGAGGRSDAAVSSVTTRRRPSGLETHRGAQIDAPLGAERAWCDRSAPDGMPVVGGAVSFDEDSADARRRRTRTNFAPGRAVCTVRCNDRNSRPHDAPPAARRERRSSDHWELAFARCREVERLLVAAGIDAKRLRLERRRRQRTGVRRRRTAAETREFAGRSVLA